MGLNFLFFFFCGVCTWGSDSRLAASLSALGGFQRRTAAAEVVVLRRSTAQRSGVAQRAILLARWRWPCVVLAAAAARTTYSYPRTRYTNYGFIMYTNYKLRLHYIYTSPTYRYSKIDPKVVIGKLGRVRQGQGLIVGHALRALRLGLTLAPGQHTSRTTPRRRGLRLELSCACLRCCRLREPKSATHTEEHVQARMLRHRHRE